jgi:hypothetical protein
LKTQKPKDSLLFIAAVAAGVDSDGRKFAPFAPSFDGERRDTEYFGYFPDGQKVRPFIA